MSRGGANDLHAVKREMTCLVDYIRPWQLK